MWRIFAGLALAALLAGSAPGAQAQTGDGRKSPLPFTVAPDVAEPGSVEAIAKATGDSRFVSPWVAYLPESSQVPSPMKFYRRIMGAPGELVDSGQAYAYCRALAAASPRVRLFTIGHSEEGREIEMLAIADEAGIRELDRLKADTAALADPRITDPEAAERLIATARPIYYFNATIHSDETGSTEAMLELAYRLAVSEQPMIQRIRRELVVLINPVSSPDGRDKDVEWFYRYLKGKTVRDTLPRMSPPYWGKYVFVDLNRDAHQVTMETTKAVHRMFYEWHPTVVHDLHEGSPLMMTWNGTGPYNPNIDPITYTEFLELSFHEVETMTGFGMPGVSTWNFGEAFAHLYLDSVAMNHNSIGRGYETWGNGSAETFHRVLRPSAAAKEWWRPLPAPADVEWSMRDNLNYQETGALAALDDMAQNAKQMLRNFYKKGWDSWQKGLHEPPYAFLIPANQGDPMRVAQMVGRLMQQHIEVSRAEAPLKLKDGEYPPGTYVVRLDQPYRNYAVDLLTPQHYPKNSNEPYDDVSWELPANFHLSAMATADPEVRAARVELLATPPHPEGKVSGEAAVFLVRDTGQESLLALRYRLAAFPVQIAERAFRTGGVEYPAGSWILNEQPGLPEAMHAAAAELGLDFAGTGEPPEIPMHAAKAARIGVWVPWADTDSIGWLRYSLDQRKVPYLYLRDEDIRAGAWRHQVDVLLYGHVDLELAEQIQGLPKKWSPMPFKKTPETPAFGTPAESDDITGGIGWEGMEQIQKFVEDGGLMITLGSGTMLALEGGIVRGVRRSSGGVPRSTQGGGAESAAAAQNAETRTPGAHVRVTFDRPDSPIAYGYPVHTWVFRQNFPLYDAPRRWLRMAYCTTCLDGPEDRRGIVMEWGDTTGAPFVVSGQAWGEGRLIGRPAILDMPVGHGHVVSFNFNPMHRDMNRGDQRLLWNAIINWQAIVAAKEDSAPKKPAPEDE
ncbi:MAG TPA: M14 family zinc carboxypeptidase [Candidatus Acidoferrales bacterium]|nr:M14 family zinc carboxypeptidase [Candidatus Acidoferrales bacterium]